MVERLPAIVCVAALLLSGCRQGTPSGQVAATVDGQEITLRDLAAESRPVAGSDPKAAKAAEVAALGRIVDRKLIAEEARRERIDRSPDFAIERQAAEELLLARMLEAKIAGEVPSPSIEDAQAFIEAHPEQFSNRKIFQVDQIVTAPPPGVDLRPIIKPLNTLDAVEAALVAKNIKVIRGNVSLDALSLDPRTVDEIEKLPPNAVFAFATNKELHIAQVKSVATVPFTGDQAVKFATAYLKRQRAQQAVAKKLGTVIQAGASKVRYSPTFAPPTAKKPHA